MQISDPKYEQRDIFLELKSYTDFYEDFSFLVWGFCTVGTGYICNIDAYIYTSMQKTIDSMSILLKKGRVNDSYALLRKYHDLVIINVYTNLYLKSHSSPEKPAVEKINNWLQGVDQLPSYKIMLKYIKNSTLLKGTLNSLFYVDERYDKIRQRCNNNMHYNDFANVQLNDEGRNLKKRIDEIDMFSKDVRDIFILNLSYMFFLNDHYMMDSDYIDYLEHGLTPPEGSQYWVAPFVQEIFDNVLLEHRSDIASVIKNNTCMQLAYPLNHSV